MKGYKADEAIGSFLGLLYTEEDREKGRPQHNLDMVFISAITNSVIDEEMVKWVNEIAHLMGKKTIAQCVEDEATANSLSLIGVDYMQGHWIAYPKELQ